jgi:hypothetical protein
VANLILAWNNRVDGATLSGGSWQSTLPLANVKDYRLSKLARTVGKTTANTKMDIDITAAKPVGVVSLVGHNLSAAAKVRVKGATEATFAAPIYDSGWVDVWPSNMIPQELLEWEDDNFWMGTIPAETRAGYSAPYINLISSRPSLRYWRIEIDDTTNVSTNLDVGRVVIADTWTVQTNISSGASLGHEDASITEESIGGEEYYDERKKFRVFRFSLDNLTEAEAHAKVLDLQRLEGTTGQVLCIPNASDLTNGFRRNFLGRLRSMSPMVYANYTQRTTQFEIKEVF